MASQGEWIGDALARFEAPLLRYAARLLGDAERARDVVQETFLSLCQADRQRIEGHLAPWLYRVCRNRALDLRRKEKRVQPLPTNAEQALESPEPGPAAAAETRQGASRVLAMVHTLPESQQEAIFLRFGAHMSYRQISDVTGHSVSAVGVLIHKAVASIRAELARADAAATDRRASNQTAEVIR
jgi:RNA polymerase sigma-70 factor (ECF subfamily)